MRRQPRPVRASYNLSDDAIKMGFAGMIMVFGEISTGAKVDYQVKR